MLIEKKAYLGLDIGTTAIKIIATDSNSNLICNATEKLKIYHPHPGWSEQDPIDWWNATKKVLLKVKKNLDAKNYQIVSMGFSGQMHSLVMLDKNNNPIHNSILWNDVRTKNECKEIRKIFGKKIYDITGNPALEGFTAPKIIWMKKNLPEKYKLIKKIMLPKDYIRFRLTGKIMTDPSDATGTLLYDIKQNNWSEFICNKLGIDKKILPKVNASHKFSGKLTSKIVGDLNLDKNIFIVTGGADNACSLLSINNINNSAVISLGTSGTIMIPTERLIIDKVTGIHLMKHTLPEFNYRMGVILSAGSSLNWWQKILPNKTIDQIIKIAKRADKHEDQVIFLPYLSGERTPHQNPDARGVFFGINASSSSSELTHAVLQGIGFAIKNSLDILSKDHKISSAIIVGGGGKSNKWSQIICDILNLELIRYEINDGAALGASYLGKIGFSKDFNLDNHLQRRNENFRVFKPKLNNHKFYKNVYKNYNNLYKILTKQFKK